MKNTKIKLAGILLGAALASTGAYAGEKSGSCGAGKCGGDMKKVEKKMDGSCGAGKCGGDMKKKAGEMSGKAGGDMKKSSDEMSGKAGKKMSGSCGAGKCG